MNRFAVPLSPIVGRRPLAALLAAAFAFAGGAVVAQTAPVPAPTVAVTDFFPVNTLTSRFLKPGLASAIGFNGAEARGTVNLGLTMHNRDGVTVPLLGATIIYTLDGEPISPRIGAPYTFAWDTSSAPEGTHALGVVVVDGQPDIGEIRVMPAIIVVDNQPGPVAGPQRVPTLGNTFKVDRTISAVPDWVNIAGAASRPHATARPLPAKVSPPAYSLPTPTAALDSLNWFLEPLTESNTGLYQGKPALIRNRNGHPFTATFISQEPNETSEALPFVKRKLGYDGPRNDNYVSPYSTYVPNPTGTGWVGVDIAGRVFRVSATGDVTTIAGQVTDPNAIPYNWADTAAAADALRGTITRTIGTFENGTLFKGPTDLAFDPRNANILYIADYLNHRIAKIDLSVTPPRITTLAGRAGVAGYADGPAATALFNEPSSIAAAPDGTLYVADEHNRAIRRISPDGLTVSTLAVHTLQVPLAPFAIRLDSAGDVILIEKTTGLVKKVLAASGSVRTIRQVIDCISQWSWLDVDRRGNVGPKDDILLACVTGGRQHTYRVSKDGLRAGVWPGYPGSLEQGPVAAAFEPGGHYAWVVAIDDTESKIVYQGIANLGLRQLRMRQPGDPAYGSFLSVKYPVLERGRQIYLRGTVPAFPFGMRPSFTALRGITGHGYLGAVPNFDDLVGMTNAQLGAYIQSGFGGSVPRPEITGRDLAALIYYIRVNSIQGLVQEPPVPGNPLDVAAATVSNVAVRRIDADTLEVAWETNEATLGFVAFGVNAQYHRWSEPEAGFGRFHVARLTDVPRGKEINFAIRVRDEAGNQTQTANRIFNDGPAALPQIAISVTPDKLNAGGTVTLKWSTSGARSCTGSNGWVGALPVSGSQVRGPLSRSTTFTLTCTGPGGTGIASAVATVIPPPPAPVVTFTATPSIVPLGGSATLAWNATNATACQAAVGWTGAKPLSGTTTTGPITTSKIYALTCAGPGGSVTRYATVRPGTTAVSAPLR